jgi:OOP family OmpA-OmpF porin
MKVFISLAGLLLIAINSQSQNLVVNPDFEMKGNCAGVIEANSALPGWYSANDGSPDYYSALKNNLADYKSKLTPSNLAGTQVPSSGIAYAGFIAYTNAIQGYSEYLGGTLTENLVAGMKYHFSMNIALSNKSVFGIEQIGIYFSVDSLHQKGQNTIVLEPQLINDHSVVLTKSAGWMKYEMDYIATGDEHFFVIGNFSLPDKINIIKTGRKKGIPYAYYYIDDVSLKPAFTQPLMGNVLMTNDPNTPETGNDTLGIVAGKKLVTGNIYFETDEALLKKESFPLLDEISGQLKMQPALKVEIDGHTDSDGTPEHNLQLSKERAEAVKQYLMHNGIDASRISTNGFGSSKPISSDKNKNRRVEFIFSE